MKRVHVFRGGGVFLSYKYDPIRWYHHWPEDLRGIAMKGYSVFPKLQYY